MCGIAGVFMTGSGARRESAERAVEAMTLALSHRGPDGRGVADCTVGAGGEADGGVWFGHTRLAVIDLTDRAGQPMANADRSIWLTYNGEIYNYRTLRDELVRAGQRFVSDSDTEVLLRGYEHWGEAVVDRLHGMFAFAIWNSRESRLLLVRDRLGIKPLYVYRTPGVVAFASEVRALLASGLAPRRLDPAGLGHYLGYQTTATPRTLVRDVSMLPPATTLSIDASGGATDRTYWSLLPNDDRAPARAPSRNEGIARVRDLLAAAVRAHLVSDVPVGIFLSSGLDSTAVAALVADAAIVPHTFTLSVPGVADDEGPLAAEIAARLGADHTEVVLTPDEVRKAVERGLTAFDHPSGDALNAFVLAEAVRSAGVKVALSGLGGDELFGGYPSFTRLRAARKYSAVWRRVPRSIRGTVGAAVRGLGAASVQHDKLSDVIAGNGSVAEAYPILRQLFSTRARTRLVSPVLAEVLAGEADPYVTMLGASDPRVARTDTMTQIAYAEARTYMHDVLLRDTDQMSMRHGLEVRVPLLDHHLVECVMALPEALKAPAPRPKALLEDAVGTLLPPDAGHGPKRGFVLPFDAWMRDGLQATCEHHLGDDGLAGRRFMNREGVRAVWQDFLARRPTTSWSRPWALVALNAWLESTHVDL